MMKKMAADFYTKIKKLDPHMACLVNSCQEKVAEVLVRLKYSIHQHALALDVILVEAILILLGKHNSLFVYSRSLSDSK